jgi:hypothetical protein
MIFFFSCFFLILNITKKEREENQYELFLYFLFFQKKETPLNFFFTSQHIFGW